MATALAGEMTVLVPMADLIDREAELVRLKKQLERLEGEVERAQTKLANTKFVARAPENVVLKERDRLKEATAGAEKLRAQIVRLGASHH